MKARVVRIGNSRGIRIPKSIIEQCHLHGAVDLEIQQGQLVIRSASKPRAGWADAFEEMYRHGDDRLLDAEIGSSSMWDGKEWTENKRGQAGFLEASSVGNCEKE